MAISLLDLIFPSNCIVCGKAPKPMCSGCVPPAEIFEIAGFGFPVYTAFIFDGAIAKLITGYKDQQLTALQGHLAAATSELFAQLDFSQISAVITPAKNPKNYRKRGFDTANQLAKRALQINQVSIPVVSLSNLRARADQRGLSRLERAANVSGGMALRQKTTGEVVLFDDVLTTGSTLVEMARACEAAGVKVAFCCVLAQKFLDF